MSNAMRDRQHNDSHDHHDGPNKHSMHEMHDHMHMDAPVASKFTLAIHGANCASCVKTIETALRAVPNVKAATMNLVDRSATVEGAADPDALVAAIKKSGYEATLLSTDSESSNEKIEQAHYKKRLRDMTIALAVGAPLMLWGLIGDGLIGGENIGSANGESMMVMPGTPQLIWGGVGVLTFLVLWIAGGHFFRGAWQALRHRQATMDTLIALGTGSAWLYSMLVVIFPGAFPMSSRHVYFEASAVIIGLINLGQALEIRGRGKTSQAIRRLLDLTPSIAHRISPDDKNDSEEDLPVERVRVDDLLRVRPGEKIPVDGIVVDGDSYIDESMLSGEPMPVRKQKNATIAAGTLNQNGTLVFRSTRIGADTALARIIALVKNAQSSKLPIGRLADRISAIFVPIVVLIAIVAAFAWWQFGPEPKIAHMLVAAMTVLIIACPCALGLATPMSVMVGIGKAASAGILIRRGDALQTSAQLDTIVLDKTGTITEGKPDVIDIFSADGNEQQLLQLAASVEQYSEHPLARAIVRAANGKHTQPQAATNFIAYNGKGVSAEIAGEKLLIGNRRWLDEQGIDCSALATATERMVAQAAIPLFVASNRQALGVIGVADRIKHDSADAIARLHARGLKVLMLTGDHVVAAQAIARAVGIDEVVAEVLPEHKAEKIKELRAQQRKVGMVGDGINDAPALAEADVGFAIGTGTDIAIESADIALMQGSLHGVADAIEISQATLRNIKQNLFGAFIYNVLGIPIAAGILYPVFGLLMNPILAGAAMSLSSVTVVMNANRLRLLRVTAHSSGKNNKAVD